MKRKRLGTTQNGSSTRRKKRVRSRQRCGHCYALLSHSRYHEHRRQFYNAETQRWKISTTEQIRTAEYADVPGSSSSDSEGKRVCKSYLGAIFLCLSQQKDLFQFLGGGGGRKNECLQARCSVCSAQPPHTKLEFLLLQKQRQRIAIHVYFHKDLAHG